MPRTETSPRDNQGPPVDVCIRVRRGLGARIDRPRVRLLCQAVLRGEGWTEQARLSIRICDDGEIRRLNKEHRQIDRPTDVLSFSLVVPTEQEFPLPPGEAWELGDIVVSYPRAVAQATEYGHSTERELAYLIAHGLLHVLGHDHDEADERREMRAREEAALATVGLSR
jgi:probable rRNA maturation factor